jgi:hypothetical protein
LRATHYGSLLVGCVAAIHGQESPLVVPRSTWEPASPETPSVPQVDQRPPSFSASNPPQATSALVNDQTTRFWGSRNQELLRNPFTWGPFELRPFATYRFTYGTGLNSQPGQEEPTALNEISPGALIRSEHVSLTYSPTLNYYSSDAFEDSLDHDLSAEAHYAIGDWNFSLSHHYEKSSPPLIETGAQTPQENHSTSLTTHYQHSDDISFDFTLLQQIQDTDELNSSKTWSLMNWVNYHYSDQTLFGIGLGPGYTKQEFGSDMTYQQLQGRIDWRPGLKLSVNLNGGGEFRQFDDENAENQLSPIYGASILYTPIEPTTFSLSANRSVGAALVQAQTTESTVFSAGLRQRIVRNFFFDVFGSFSSTDYQNFTRDGDLTADRSDDVTSLSLTVSTTVLERGTASIFYERSQNDSSVEGYTFNSNQYGFQLGYRF